MFSTFENNDRLSDLVIDRTEAWYDAKHSSFSRPEIEFVNSMKVKCCPYYGSDRFRKIGYRKGGTQCFCCNSCHRKFNPLTGSIFDSRKIPIGEWTEFLIHLFQYQSISDASIDNRNAYSTGRYWLNKIFEVLKNYQADIVMGERFWTDETYLKLMSKDLKRDEKESLCYSQAFLFFNETVSPFCSNLSDIKLNVALNLSCMPSPMRVKPKRLANKRKRSPLLAEIFCFRSSSIPLANSSRAIYLISLGVVPSLGPRSIGVSCPKA